AALIITENKEVRTSIMEKTGRGVTHWQGKGAYTENDKDILFCATNRYEIPELRTIVTDIDPNAFITLIEGPMIEGGFEKRL
ncbi:MAG: YitT family protein, partial [Erysipelotrichaceae bacterium]|nr:YitT family protein [Erysipelotrichaceae bacterium]